MHRGDLCVPAHSTSVAPYHPLSAQVLESGSFVTISGVGSVLTLGYGPNSGSPFEAQTVPPWTNIETTSGIVHKINNLLIDGLAYTTLAASIPGGPPSPLFV